MSALLSAKFDFCAPTSFRLINKKSMLIVYRQRIVLALNLLYKVKPIEKICKLNLSKCTESIAVKF